MKINKTLKDVLKLQTIVVNNKMKRFKQSIEFKYQNHVKLFLIF